MLAAGARSPSDDTCLVLWEGIVLQQQLVLQQQQQWQRQCFRNRKVESVRVESHQHFEDMFRFTCWGSSVTKQCLVYGWFLFFVLCPLLFLVFVIVPHCPILCFRKRSDGLLHMALILRAGRQAELAAFTGHYGLTTSPAPANGYFSPFQEKSNRSPAPRDESVCVPIIPKNCAKNEFQYNAINFKNLAESFFFFSVRVIIIEAYCKVS